MQVTKNGCSIGGSAVDSGRSVRPESVPTEVSVGSQSSHQSRQQAVKQNYMLGKRK